MNNKEYIKLVNSKTPKEPKLKNAIYAFLSGGLVGFIGEVIVNILTTSFGLSRVDSYSYLGMFVIIFACILTAIGKFDNLMEKYKCGLIIPTTGFAHSVQSASLDYKKEGFVTGIGSNYFKLAGSVIVSGIVASFFLSIIRVILWQL